VRNTVAWKNSVMVARTMIELRLLMAAVMKMLTILKANRLSWHMWHNTAQHTTTQYGIGTQNSVLTVEHRTQVYS
jgi:hypothetical protein